MYLTFREPIPINVNPFVILKNDPIAEYNDPAIKASNYVISILRFRRSLKDNVLSPDITYLKKDKKLATVYHDMSQYNSMFGATRIASLEKDYLQMDPSSRHIIIMKDGDFYKLNVLDEYENIASPQFIYSNIKYICDTPNVPSNQYCIGVLTTRPRDDWANLRSQLEKIEENKASLESIDCALFDLCLDTGVSSLEVDECRTLAYHSHNFLHGCDNNESKPINRWFDKSFSIIVTQSGLSALNWEHSWGDGVTLRRFWDRVYPDSIKRHFVGPDIAPCSELINSKDFQKLSFNLTPSLEATISKARKSYQQFTNQLELRVTKVDNVTKSFFKNLKIGPDAVFQLSFQLAYYKLFNGQTTGTYEACSTSRFKHGRTETVRSATSLTKQACQMLENKEDYSNDQLQDALKDCFNLHSQLVKEASFGQGFDRHLFALKTLALKEGVKNVELFEDEAYAFATKYRLSTSMIFDGYIIGGGFGPVIEDGFGISYGYHNNVMTIYCSNFSNLQNGLQFGDAFKESVNQICSILGK